MFLDSIVLKNARHRDFRSVTMRAGAKKGEKAEDKTEQHVTEHCTAWAHGFS
jgi:hypothetical protein